MHADIVKENDSEILTKVLGGSLSNSEIYQLLYSAVVDKDYSFLQCLLKHSRLDFYEPFEADGFRLPILHHAVRLGDFNAFKLLLEYGLNPLVCAGICQQNDTEFICEDIIQFAFRFTSNPNNQKSILLLFQTFLHLVEACRKGDDESIEQLLTSSSSGSLRIRCTVKRFASRQFHLVVNSSNSSHDSSTDHVNDSIKPIHQPLTSLISNRLKSFKFNRRLSWITGSSRDNKKMEKKEKEEGQQQQDRPQTMLESLSSKEILRWSSDGIFESYNLQSMNNDLWEWARSQVKPLLVICVQNNYIQCLNKLLQVGFEVIPVNSSLSTTFSATEESVELLNHKQEINHDSKFNNGLRILVEDISSIGKQQLWIESVCSNQESAIHTAVRLNREEAVKSIIQWEPYSLAVTCHSNNDISIGILPIHIACALNRLNCLQLILTMNTSTLYLNNDYYNIENSESKLDLNHCNLFSCRINKSPGLYKHYYCIDQLDSYNMTGFLLAVIHGHVDIVRQLLKYTVKAKKLMNSTTTELHNFNIDINLDHLYQHHSTVPDNNTSTTNTTDTDKCTCSNELDVLGNQHSSLTDPCIDHTVYYDVCPIDIYRKISACWYFVTSIDNNNNNSVSLDYNRRPTIIINPRCHQSLDDHAICGYFNALQLSVMTGNIDTVSILVDYLSREVNTFCTSCMHGQCYVLQDHSTLSMVSLSNSTCYSSHLTDEIVSSNLNPTNLQSIITTPLGLTCCLAETDENKAIEIASVLLNIGAVDLNNQLFIYTMKKAFYKFAGLLFIHEILLKSTEIKKPTENDPAVIIRHLNLSNMKSLQCSIISNSFWYLSSIIPQWIKLLEDLSKFNYVSSLKSSSSSMSTSVKQESTMNENNDNREFYKYISQLFLSLPRPTFTMNFFNNISNQLITRITMSNCGLKTLPWCLFNCVKNLKELDLSKNHIRNLPTQLPNVPMAYRSCQSVSTCWTSSLIYLDLSENCLDYLPSWLFVNMYEYEKGIISSSCKGKLNNNIIDSHPLRRCYSETSINTTTSSLHHTTVMNDSFAPNLLHLLLSKNQLRVLPSEIWTGSLWCKLESLDLSWNKIAYLPMPNLLKVQFEHSRQMYKQSLYMKIFHEFQLIKSLSFGIQPSCKVNLGSSYFMSTEKEIVLLFPKLKSLDLGENPYLKCIYPSLLHSMNLQYLSLDCCITLCELPGDLFRLPNLQSILLNKTPFIKHLATLIDPTLKVNQVAGIQGNNNDNDVNDYPNLNEKIYTRRILSCLKSVTDQSYPYTRFRVMVVGPTGVGKTTLVRLLQASETGKSSCQTNFNLNPFETDVHTSSSSSLRSNETDNIPDHLLPSVQITNLTISRHNNSKPNESINANVSSGITDNHRNFCETLSFSIWDLEKSVNTTISSVNTTTNNNDNFGSSISDMSSELVFPSEVIINTQLGIHCQLTIYLVLWNTSDGVLGLNRITPWLMKIKIEKIQKKISKLITLLYNAAYHFNITNRTADILFPNISIIPSLSQSFLQLSIPKLYHLTDSITQQLTIEIFNNQLIPIMEVNRFIFELNKCLSNLLPHPIRNCHTLKRTEWMNTNTIQQYYDELMKSTQDISQLQDQVNDDHDHDHDKDVNHSKHIPNIVDNNNSFYLKRNSAVIDSSYLTDLIKYFMGTRKTVNDNTSHIHMNNLHDIPLEEIFLGLFKQFGLMVSIITNDDLKRQKSDSSKMRKHKKQLLLLPSLLAARCFQPGRLHSYLQPAVIRYEVKRIYNLSKLPSELFQQLLCNKLQHNDNFKNCCEYNCSTDSRNDHGNIDNCHTFMNTSLKPEWTVWKRGMRLSLGHGQIGLARLQQLTRANCALLRSQSFKQSFLNVANNRQSPSLRAFVSSCSPRSSSFSSTRKTNELIAKLLPQSYYHEEWDEPCAIVGEEVMKQNKKSINNQNISNIEKDFISFNLQLNNDFVYRSGVVETIKHSYEGRCLRLMHWVVQDDQKNEGFQSFSTTMKPITTELSSLATTACQEQTVKTASDFKIHCNHGYLTDQEHDALQNSCLIEIYLPNLNIYWEYKQTDKYPTVNSNQAQNQLEVINSLRNHSQLRQNNLSPDPQAIAELLTKLVSHIDTLLEDWYPDLGVKLNQSNEGIYLVERIIPCCACLATPNRYLNNFSRQSLSFSTDNHLQNMMKNSSFSSVNNQFKEMDKSCYGNKYCLNQFSLHNKKLSKSVQFLNHTDKQLKSSYLNSSILSITNDLFTSDSNNNNNTITEKYLAHRNMSRNRYKRAHSADPLKFTDDSKNENGNQNKLTDPSTAYMSFVYGITVSEYIHWYVMKKSNKLSQPGGLYCPIHSSIQLWAPDLQFKDIPSTLFISTDRVHLLEFLGRGAFGSIFKGSINNSLATKQQQQIGRLSNRIPFKTTNQFNNNRATDFIREVAVKLCSPIHPNLNSSSSYCIPMFNSVNCERINLSSSKEKCSTSNLSDALFLYRQEQRRWLHNPIEACLNAYQEIRAELNILLPITRNSLYSDQYSFSSSTSSSLLYHKSKRTNRLCNSYSFHEKRSNQSCFNKCLQKNQSKDSNSNVKTNNMSNNNLLICYGIIYPNPIGFLMPLIPLGNLSDYFTSLLTSYQDLLKTTVNTLEISSATTNCMNELFINHPLHPITMMLIINQVAKGLAYLHSLSIVHRDVKSENILIWSIPLPSTMMMMASSTLGLNDQNPSKVHIVLTDYGVSRFMSVRDDDEGDNGCRGYVGTPGYMAPEILDYIGEQTYTSKVDIYAMGILLCEMIQLEQPYKKLSSSFYRLAQQVISGVRPDIPQHFIKRCPITLINLMTYCWASDSNRRPSAEQIVHLTNSYQLSTSLSNESITNDCNDDNKKKEKKSNSLSIHYQNNCFSHIQSVHSIDFLKVVTCAIIESSLVTHFLIGNSKLVSNRPEPLAEDIDASKHVCVWTYLEPDGKLDCWSAFSQTLLRSINLIQQLDNDMFSENLSTFGKINNNNVMV
ncbi:protein kinase [Schistosoma mansoni]|uniref:protein kinase n=1 Tax=Schistosoma mansoni TaxID=6183 RepID=UPI00022C83FF|nr:protein kinase [Schistosoma mansoni]|eukprot:XP_018645712.1 protein kinase [Schistosoma mansoni]